MKVGKLTILRDLVQHLHTFRGNLLRKDRFADFAQAGKWKSGGDPMDNGIRYIPPYQLAVRAFEEEYVIDRSSD